MQDETQNPGDAQGPNNASDPGAAANLWGWEGFDQDPSGEGPTAPPTDQEDSAFDPSNIAEEIRATGEVWQDTAEGIFEDVGTAFEDVGEAVGGVFDINTGDDDPWDTPPSGTVQQEGEPTFNPLFTMPWEDLGVPSPETFEEEEEEEEPIFDPLFTATPNADLSTPSPWEIEEEEEEEEEESIFTALWEDVSGQPSGMAEEEPIFTSPWEGDPTAAGADASIFPVGWDDVPDTTPEGQGDDPSTVHGETPTPFDISFDSNAMAEEISATADMWQDTAEGLFEDAGAAFEDVGETIEDVFDDTF